MQMIAFVVCRRRFPNAVRPYKSPTGVAGAVIAGLISAAIFVAFLFKRAVHSSDRRDRDRLCHRTDHLRVWGRKRLVLSPEEDTP